MIARFEGKVDLRPAHHNTTIKDTFFGRRVYIVDVALTEAEMRRIQAEASEVIWLDHHQTSVPLQASLGWGRIEQHHSGATLAWDHCFGDQALPDILAYVRDKDLWQWRLPHSRAICTALDQDIGDEDIPRVLDIDPAGLIERGTALRQKIMTEVTMIARRGVAVSEPYGLRKVTALVVNNLNHVNEVGDLAVRATSDGGLGHHLAICFGLRQDGRWIHSLRSSAGVDCERIAANRGGGGHKQSASYLADRPFPLSMDCLDWPVSLD
ncbi:MAG: hypothetical protein PF961_18865 [Planctomycetota bacterium]|nr:hypothetical protein [Planctomycetota bacterium]